MKSYAQQELDNIVAKHELWLDGKEGGERADFTDAVLIEADFSYANLSGTIFRSTNLYRAKFSYADLRGAIFTGAPLQDAIFTGADLFGANFNHANLSEAIFTDCRLWDVIGNGREIKSLQLGLYNVVYTKDVIQIGCKRMPIDAFHKLTRAQAYEMDGERAVAFYDKYFDYINSTILLSPAVEHTQ